MNRMLLSDDVTFYNFISLFLYLFLAISLSAQLAEAVEYTDCISDEGQYVYNECPGYDTKQFDGEAPVLKFGGIWSTPLLPLLPGPLWPGVVAPDRVLSMCQIELFDI